jgi:predicted ATPase/DNA-binding CsgD family transcriptional regulator
MATLDPEILSAREAEVLDALREHLTNAEIAQRLHISVRTVESHVSSLLRKLGAADRRDLAALALEVAARPSAAPTEVLGLPTYWTSFVGRSAELAELFSAITANRLVTVVGPGGVGKTRLVAVTATRAMPEFPAGGAFVDLVPVRPEFVVEAVAAALGVTERAHEPLEQLVWQRLRAGRMMLVLDNCEHALGAAAAFANSALAACPELVVIATSRERLGVTGERVVTLAPLAVPGSDGAGSPDGAGGSEAELLFVDRAAGGIGGPGDRTLIADICCRLDGMPLAIELAAARSASLGLDGLLAGLDDHLRLLSRSGAHDDRHSSMRTVIEWSHQLLDDDERAMFRRLGVFAGTFDLDSAAAVAGQGDLAATSDVIGRLADKSLLVRRNHLVGSRWRMLDTVRAYAREQLQMSGEAPDAARRHLRWAADTALLIEASLDDAGGWQSRFDLVSDDLRSALQAADPQSSGGVDFALALALGRLSYARRFLVEARDHLQQAVTRAPDDASAVRALRLAADATFAEMRGEAAFHLLQEAFSRAMSAGDARSAALAVADAATIGGRCPALFVEAPTSPELVALTDRARALQPLGDLQVEAHVALAAAWEGGLGRGKPDQGRAKAALNLARQVADPVLISGALDATACSALSSGRYKEAFHLSEERLALLERLPRHDPRTGAEVFDIFHMATEAALTAGEIEAALAHARRSYRDSTTQGLPHFAANHMVIPLALRGAFDEALREGRIMREGWENAGSPSAGWMAPSFFAAALVHGLRGRRAPYGEWWDLAMRVSQMHEEGRQSCSLFVGPRVALHLGDIDGARATSAIEADDMCGHFGAYAQSIKVEVAVVAGDPQAEKLLADAQPLAEENDFAAAFLVRAAGRLHHDDTLLKEAVVRWEAIGARFERACTLLLLPAGADQGAAELAALDCPLPLG